MANSSRQLLKATYVPVNVGQSSNQQPGQAAPPQPNLMKKIAFMRGLGVRPSELSVLKQMAVKPSAKTSAKRARLRPLPDLVEKIATIPTSTLVARYGKQLADLPANDLADFGRQLLDLRHKQINRVVAANRSANPSSSQGTSGPATRKRLRAQVAAQPNVTSLHSELAPLLTERGLPALRGVASDAPILSQLLGTLSQEASATQTAIDSFLLTFSFQPTGWLHLERLEMNPVGIEDGELVYSVPLTPLETVNITHREWSETTSTFESLVSNSLEGFSEKGVTEKNDVATAVANETKHSSAFDANAQVSFSYSGNPYSVTTSAAVDYSTKTDTTRSVKDSQAHSASITQLAASRSRNEHKQSFRVSSVSGAEDMAVRTLTNANPTQSMRVDYFRMMRRWQVDLIRYGLRMTYDLVVPNPGYALAGKVIELKSLQTEINSEFNFDITLADLTPASWEFYSAQVGVAIDPPPVATQPLMQSAPLEKSIDQFTFTTIVFDIPDGYQVVSGRFTAKVHVNGGNYDSGHRAQISLLGEQDMTAATGSAQFPDGDGIYDVGLTVGSVVGLTGNVSLMFDYYNVDSGGYVASLNVVPTAAALAAWQVEAWNKLRDAALASFNAKRQIQKDRLAVIQQEIADFDSLTLRRMEREEIMRLVLQWLFGPSFQLSPSLYEQMALGKFTPDPTVQETPYPDPTAFGKTWQSVTEYGEFIKFINNAVEWENVLFFCYPYFWDLIENWPFKKFLVHPDDDHRTFLRAGCARVVLTVRPGFETQFAQLVDYMTLPNHPHPDPNAPATPYVTIGEEIRNYAMTNYDHVPPANPDNNVRPLLYPLQIRAWNEMQSIMSLLEEFNAKAHQANPALDSNDNRYPATLTDPALATLLPLVKNGKILVDKLVLNDPWGRPYVYSSPGAHGEDYDLVTYGASGNSASNGDGLDAWITSWAEGNVVSRWYEYTPTSALNVGVTMNPPSPNAV